jgi:hypothetical protein
MTPGYWRNRFVGLRGLRAGQRLDGRSDGRDVSAGCRASVLFIPATYCAQSLSAATREDGTRP